jgi:hypothetical protein
MVSQVLSNNPGSVGRKCLFHYWVHFSEGGKVEKIIAQMKVL